MAVVRQYRVRNTINPWILWINFLLVTTVQAAVSLNISQTPLTIVTPIRPQVLVAIGNSESMDGTLSGAIMIGSGAFANTYPSATSPVYYTVPSGFTPPVQAANASGMAPYTVSQIGILVDNGPSRLNVAKGGLSAILQTYLANTDFSLMDFTTSGSALYSTWVYYMSPTGANFSFTNAPVSTNRYVTNPCYGVAIGVAYTNCLALATLYGTNVVFNNQYMQIGAASDDANINDILYAPSGFPLVFVTYNGPNPVSPYPPYFSLSTYNNNGVFLSYSNTAPNIGSFGTSPTNAGYVPASPQVMYSARGFGYGGSQSPNSGTILVPMTNLGNNPSTTSLNSAQTSFTPYLNPETNNILSTEIKAIAGQSSIAGLLTRAQTYLASVKTSGTCKALQNILLISDGLPTLDLNGKIWPPLGSAAAQGYGVTASFNSDNSLNTTNSQALTDAITVLTSLASANIKTFIIGLGAGVNPTLNPQAASTLQAMAIAGGTSNYYPALNPTAMINSLNSILTSVQNAALTTTAATVSSTQLQSGIVEFIASFVSSDTYGDWTGNLIQQSINYVTGLPSGVNGWSAQALLDAKAAGSGYNNRVIATWNSLTGNGIPFEWANLNVTQKLALQPSDLLGSVRVQYLRGSSLLEQRNGGTFRNRSHVLGDIIDSQALYVGPPAKSYGSSSYSTFVQAQANRTPMLYVGANDGMLHAFNANTGAEVFAFIPNAVFANLINLTVPSYNQNHLFYVDSSPQSNDVQFSDSSWHTMLVGGEGGGGNSIYAIDITNAPNLTNESGLANNILWEFTDSDLGLTYSLPQIAQIPSSTSNLNFAVFFGNGYNSPNNNAVLYAVNPQTGATLRKINLCASVSGACNASVAQGLSSVAVANSDGLPAQPITQVYAGDLQGNIWAVDISSSNPSAWAVRRLFKATDNSGNTQPITTAPVVSLHPQYPKLQGLLVMFATGQLLTTADITNQQLQTVYAVWDKPNISTTSTRANLQAQTLTSATSNSQNIVLASNNTVNWGTNLGWYTNLLAAGQRVISPLQLLYGALVMTVNTPPAASSCNSVFSAYLLELNYQSGGAFITPQLDINNDGKITSADQYNGQYPVGIGLPSGYSSAPTILGPNQAGNMVKIINQSGGNQSTVINPNNGPRRLGWWQIQ